MQLERSVPGSAPRRRPHRTTLAVLTVVLGSASVAWSAVGRDDAPAPISAEGLFTAPTQLGEHLVIATSVQDPAAKGVASVTVGGTCSWSLTIEGGFGGTWAGQYAGHFYPDQPTGTPGSFTMTFEQEEDGDGPTGGVAAVGPATPVASGSWPARFDFSPVLGGAMWMAVPGSATYTETDATLNVTSNDGTHVGGMVNGIAMLPLGVGDVEHASFTLTFRSAADFDCGQD